MAWTHLIHDCTTLPARSDFPTGGDAQVGSVWECDATGCGRHWEIIGYTPDEEWDWQPAPSWPQTERP